MHLKTQDKVMNNVRYPVIDWFRGFAILLMVIYHLCYDLDVFGYIDTVFGTGYWVPFRYVIVISFLLLVGLSLQFVHYKKINVKNMKVRTLQLGLASAVVTISSYFIAPQKATLFGILHLILLASWLGLLFINRPKLSAIAGTTIFALGHFVETNLFDSNWLHWIGMVEYVRPALDYAPLFPWFGVVLWGIALGYVIQSNVFISRSLLNINVTQSKFNSFLNWAGKHSLVIYLIHQPLMYGVLMVVSG